MISIVIPAHLEEKRIQPALVRLKAFLRKSKLEHEMILVANASDATASAAKAACPSIRVLKFPKPTGKGAALNKGFVRAKGSVLVMYDADGAVPPDEIANALRKLEDCDVVIGVRAFAERPWYRHVSAAVYNSITRNVFGLPFSDTQCGFKLFKAGKTRGVLRQMRSEGFEWDVEFLWLCRKKGLRVCELPVKWRAVPGGPIEKAKIRNALTLLFDTIMLRVRL